MGGSPKKPDISVPPPAAPSPMPSPVPSELAAQTAEAKRAKVASMRYGLLSTIKNEGGATGITGAGADLVTPTAKGKKTLGS